MATLYHNISNELTKELLAPGDNVSSPKLSMINTSKYLVISIDLYIEKSGVGTFYLLKDTILPPGTPLIYDSIKFSNEANEFGLYVKATKLLTFADFSAEVPTVDIIIN